MLPNPVFQLFFTEFVEISLLRKAGIPRQAQLQMQRLLELDEDRRRRGLQLPSRADRGRRGGQGGTLSSKRAVVLQSRGHGECVLSLLSYES